MSQTPPAGRSPRVLVLAEEANPEWVSVPLVGWSIANALRDVADVHLVTQVRNREAILRAGLVEGRDFTAIDSEKVAAPLYKFAEKLRGAGKGWTLNTAIGSISYRYFERLVWKRFGRELKAGGWDIVHRVTPVSLPAQSPIAAKCARAGVPFLMGPLNGGVPWPKGFDAARRREREWLSYVRGAYRHLPGHRAMIRATTAFLVGSRHTMSELPQAAQSRAVYLPENAIEPARFSKVATQGPKGPLRVVFIGRLVPYKGPDMLIEAATPLLKSGQMQLNILGDGPLRGELETKIAAHDLGDAVTFHGMVDHGAVQDIASRAHVMGFPSIREFGGGVVLEAMMMGLVPIVVDYAGPGELVDDSFGFKIPIGPRAGIVAALSKQLGALAGDRSALGPMAAAGRARAETHFTWPAKAAQVAQVYEWVLAGAKGPPPKVL